MVMLPLNLDSKHSGSQPQRPYPNAFDSALGKDLLLNSTSIDAACWSLRAHSTAL